MSRVDGITLRAFFLVRSDSRPNDQHSVITCPIAGCLALTEAVKMLPLRHTLSYVVFVLLTGLLSSTWAHTDYHERLHLRPLPQSALLASFNFRSNTSSASFEQQNFQYFPRSLAQILQHAHAKELHLRFSLGRWDAESWGMRPWGGAKEGGTGVELWAWVEAETLEESATSFCEEVINQSDPILEPMPGGPPSPTPSPVSSVPLSTS